MVGSRRSSGIIRPRFCLSLSLLLLLLVAALHLCASEDGTLNVLMVGNSYTSPVAPMVRSLLEETLAARNETVHLLPITAGGARLEGWANNANLRNALLDNAIASHREWDYVVLQDQSQMPGFQMPSSVEAVAAIDNMVKENGDATIVFYMTWGRQRGDATNQWIYPDFKTMNLRLKEGYFLYRDEISTPDRPVLIAPVGPAFEAVYDAVVTEGGDPTGPVESLFSKLYSRDGSHASAVGSYLAACVIAQTLTGMDPRELSWRPSGVAEADGEAMREFVWQAVGEFSGEQHTRQPTNFPTASLMTLPPTGAPVVARTVEPMQSPLVEPETAGVIPESTETQTVSRPMTLPTWAPVVARSVEPTQSPLVEPDTGGSIPESTETQPASGGTERDALASCLLLLPALQFVLSFHHVTKAW